MNLILTIVLAVLIAANLWLGYTTLRRERERRRKLQERIDEFDKSAGEMIAKYERMKFNYNEQLKLVTILKRDYEKLQRDYERYKDENSNAEHLDNTDKPETEEPQPEPMSILALDFQDLKKSYNELSLRYANPSKTYVVRNLFRLYDIKSQSELAKLLGVSTPAINRMLKKK